MMKGSYGNAITELLSANGIQRSATNYKNLAKCNEGLDRIKDAMDNYDLAIEEAGKESNQQELKKEKNNLIAEINLEKGKLLVKQRQGEQAIACFTKAIDLLKDAKGESPFLAELYLERGKCLREEDSNKESIEDLENAINRLQKSSGSKNKLAQAHNQLGLSYFKDGRFEKALDQYNKAIDIDGENDIYYNNRSLALSHSKQLDAALADLKKALEIKSDDPRTYYNRGSIYKSKKEFELAHEDFDRAIELAERIPAYKNSSSFYHAKGLAFSYDHQYKAAKECFRIAMDRDPSNMQSIFHYGLMQHRLKELSGALASFTTVIENKPKKDGLSKEKMEDRIVYESRGLVYFDMKNYIMALEDFDKAIEIQPEYPETYFHRGQTKNFLKKYDDAISDFKDALDKNSENKGGIFNGMGLSYKMKGEYDKALSYLNQAVETDPKNHEFLLQRSMLHLAQNRFKQSIADLTESLKHKMNDPFTLYKKGVAHYLEKEFQEALNNLSAALQFEPEPSYEPDIQYHIGLSFANLEEFENAIEPFSEAIALCPLEAVYYHERAKAYLLTEQYEDAVDDYDKVIELQPFNPHAYFGRGFAHKNLRNYEKAADDFERAKEISPDDPKLIVNYKKLFHVKFIKLCNPGEEMV